MRRPDFVSGLLPRVAALVSILAFAGCGGGGGANNQDSGTGGQTAAGGHTGAGGSGSGGSAGSGAGGSVTDSGTDLQKADAGTGGAGGAAGMTGAGGAAGMTGAGGGTGGQMDAGMETATGAGGSGMGGAGGDVDAGMDVPADSGAGGGGAADAGADADGGSADAGPLATGVVKISVPLATTGTGQRYNVQNHNAIVPDVPYNLSGQTLTIRAYAPGAIGGDISVFFRSPMVVDGAAVSSVDSTPVKVALSTLTGGFTDAQITVPAAAGNFDPTMIDVIRLEIEADATFGMTFETPATIVYIDSIISSNGAVMLPFDTAPAATDIASSGARSVAGSTGPTFQATFP